MRPIISVATLSALIFFVSCGKNKDESNNNNPNNGQLALKPTADLSGATGIFVVDPSKSSGTGLIEEHNRRAKLIGAPLLEKDDSALFLDAGSSSEDGTKSLQKSGTDGKIVSALSVKSEGSSTDSSSTTQQTPSLPKIRTIAVSPAPYSEVFLHFETSFRFKIPETEIVMSPGVDPRSDGSYCQLFRVKGGSVADLQKTAPSTENLECLDSEHFIDGWQSQRLSVFQFDGSGNVYYPGQIPNSSKLVVYKWNRINGNLTEMINSNICVQDFLVTKSGGMFYTGTSSCNGGGSSSGGFFRYIAGSSGTLTEIARDWWNFIYEPSSSDTGDKAIFFGPDPTSASSASWNSACLFKFDPAGGDTTALRTSSVITCGSDIWNWIRMTRAQDVATYGKGFDNSEEATSAWKTEFANRCTSSGQIFAGGGSQISSILQDSTGQVYVIGNVRKKNAGTATCRVEIRGPHCKVNGIPSKGVTTETACSSAGGTWVDDGFCQSGGTGVTSATCLATVGAVWSRRGTFYNDAPSDFCSQTDSLVPNADWWSSDNTKSFQNAASTAANTMKFRMNGMDCAPPSTTNQGDPWTSEYKGLGKVNADLKTLSLISGTDEQAISMWVIGDKVYYAAFNATTGHYMLRNYDGTKVATMADNLEVYNLSASPDDSLLILDGLDFTNNSYIFGNIGVAAPFTRTTTVGLTGTLKTVVILPKF